MVWDRLFKRKQIPFEARTELWSLINTYRYAKSGSVKAIVRRLTKILEEY